MKNHGTAPTVMDSASTPARFARQYKGLAAVRTEAVRPANAGRRYALVSSPGKLRGLRAISRNGCFAIAAMDHRGTFRHMYRRDLSYSEVRGLKRAMITALGSEPTAFLLDPEYGIGLDVPEKGLVLTIEASGFTEHDGYRETKLLTGWTVEKIKRLGASGVKLIVQIDPRLPQSVKAARTLATQIALQCTSFDLPLLLEPIVPGDGDLVVPALRVLGDIPADVFKLQYPGDGMLKEIKPLLDVPWTLLSAGADFERFAQRLACACEAGCSGFVAGRALWKELASCETEAAREQFIQQVVANRFRTLTQIVNSTAHSMWETISLDLEVQNRWYEDYNALSAPAAATG